jgi:uncharacterized protein (UPF0332 family)
MNDEVRKFLEKADHALIVALDLRERGHAPDAASKTYYAMFYAAQALLKSEGIEVTKHSAVESAFGYHFVKTGRIDRKYHRMLITARKIREIADYDIDEEIVEPTATVKIEEGREFVTVVKQYLGLGS